MPYQAPRNRGTTPGGKGRFPGFDVLREVDRWDDVTAGAVLARLAPQPDLAFFTRDEHPIAEALVDRLLAQDDEPKVPVVRMIDVRLAQNETDGWRYEDMPEDREAWRLTLRLLDDDARAAFGRGFAACGPDEQSQLVQSVQDRVGRQWHGLPAKHVWSLWTRYACAAFYSHPWAWNEIGFSGPAYPRGYKNIGLDAREPWEVPDRIAADPVEFADRTARARRAHARPVEQRLDTDDGEDGAG